MRNYRITFLTLLAAAVVVSGAAVTSFRTQNRAGEKPARKSQKMFEQESRLPVADYDAAEPADPKEKEKREAKAKKYARTELSVDPDVEAVTTSGHWAVGIPAIPAGRSDLVVTGVVSQAQAKLTPRRKKVYSEFTVTVDEILKNDELKPLSPGETVTADRAGGRVRYPSGKVGAYWITGQGMPQVGMKYLLFLTKTDPEAGYSILTGYELREGRISLLDNPGSGHPITASEGADASSFLNQVRSAIANP
jgi:hypothetical protein